MTSPPVTERGLIEIIRRAAVPTPGVRVGIGDDCAVLEPEPGHQLLATTDLLLEDIHFRRWYASPEDIGWKALAVNLSDIAAMGGRPAWALVALACPPSVTTDEVEGFWRGLLELAGQHAVAVVGGDTATSAAGWAVNVTLLGQTERPPLLRSAAQAGDVVAVTGALGRSAAGLAVLQRPAPVPPLDPGTRAAVVRAHLRPRPRVSEGRWLAVAGGVRAMIDLSDGLATDLGHVARESAVGARVDLARLPVDPATRAVALALGADVVAWATSGGEDYELLLTCAPEVFPQLADGLAQATGTTLHAIGEVVAAGGLRWLGADGRETSVAAGFEHFVSGRSRD